MDRVYWKNRIMDGCSFNDLPVELRDDPDFCVSLLGWWGISFEHFSDSLKRNYEFCLKMLGLNSYNIRYIPIDVERYHDLCLFAFDHGADLYCIPSEFRDREICLAALEHGSSLYYIPLEVLDFGMCLTAVLKDGHNFDHVPVGWQRKVSFLVSLLNFSDCVQMVKTVRIVYG